MIRAAQYKLSDEPLQFFSILHCSEMRNTWISIQAPKQCKISILPSHKYEYVSVVQYSYLNSFAEKPTLSNGMPKIKFRINLCEPERWSVELEPPK